MKKRKDGRYQKVITIKGERFPFYGRTMAEVNKQIFEFREKEEKGKLFSEVAEEWEKRHLEEVPETTYKKCGQAEYNRAVEKFGKAYIKEVTAQDIDVYIKDLAKKDYSRKTVSSYKNIVSQIFDYGILKDYVKYNPVSAVTIPKNLSKKTRTLPTTADIKTVSENYKGFALLPYFLLYTGLRISEAVALTDKDINREDMTITVNKKVVFDGNKPILKHETKTESGTRQVILLKRLEEKIPKFKGYLFSDNGKDLYTRNTIRHRWKIYKQETGVKLTAHQLRHAYATMLFEAGIDEKDAQELMGHSDIKLTRSIYTHIRQERKEKTAVALNAFEF